MITPAETHPAEANPFKGDLLWLSNVEIRSDSKTHPEAADEGDREMARWAKTASIMASLALLGASAAKAWGYAQTLLPPVNLPSLLTIADGPLSPSPVGWEDSAVNQFGEPGGFEAEEFEGGITAHGNQADSRATPIASRSTSASQQPELPDEPKPANSTSTQEAGTQCNKPPCNGQRMNWYRRFVNGPQVKPLTPEEKGWLALRNFLDPFNAITILGEAGIAIGSDSHTPYGPGMPGYGRYVGVSYAEDLTGEFFNTFLICSIAHQDPHYHRMPHASYVRRSLHAVSQVVWTQGDNERGMLNYANLVGFGIDDEIANLYVPGRETNARASAERYATGLATAPITNFVTEFLPDVASHIHVQQVIVQRIINQVANKETAGQ